MYIFNKEKYILRIEYFGGLLINKKTMEKYEISKYDAIFLLGVKYFINTNLIQDFIKEKYDINFDPNINEYIKLEIINKNNNIKYKKITKENIHNILYEEFKKTEKTNHLRSPMELTIYPTFKCQLECEFCFLGEEKNKHFIEYDSNEWIKLIKSFVKEGVLSVSILGGEPSLYYEIIPLLKRIDDLGIKITLTTNAQNWSDELFQTVVSSKNITTIVSLETLNNYSSSQKMGRNFDTNKAKKLLLKLRKNKKPCRVNTVYTKQSTEEILEIVDFCALHKIEKYSIALCFSTDDKMPTIKETNLLGQKIKTYIKEKLYENLSFVVEGCMVYSSYDNINGKVVNTEFQKKQYGCECGNTILEIIPDGSMYSCATFISQSKSQSIGNAFNEDWQKIWYESKKLKKLRETKCEDLICQSCELYHFCNGGCPTYKKLKGIKKVFSTHDDRCEIYKKLKGEQM